MLEGPLQNRRFEIRLLGYVTMGYMEPRTHFFGTRSPRVIGNVANAVQEEELQEPLG